MSSELPDTLSAPNTSGISLRAPSFFIAGVGASAGGLEAFTELLHEMSAETNMAFVLVQHLAPHHQSLLTELLSKVTRLKVSEVENKTAVQPGHVYVMPPNCEVSISNGVLFLSDRINVEGRNMSIDAFFRSLAEDQKEKAIGIVLSGSESDGVLGLEKIKAEGGITFAQDEASAKYKDMPRKAAASGSVDFVLPPRGIASHLARLPKDVSAHYAKAREKNNLSADDVKIIASILEGLKVSTGMDFGQYKTATVFRRITRRMILRRVRDLESYQKLAAKDAEEAQALRKDILINVTSFFREPASFDTLKDKVFPGILSRRRDNAAIRIWIPGCSTGNEAYSIAICLHEFLQDNPVPVQIFATDVSEASVENARRGIYPANIRLDVSPQRLERYFDENGGGYQIKRFVRDMCIFATHNLLSDPPFSDIDLVSCRNVMIYLEPLLQKKAISFFHYALKPMGTLMLGSSESAVGFADYFTPIDKKLKIYSKTKSIKNGRPMHFSITSAGKKIPGSGAGGDLKPGQGFDARKKAQQLVSKSKNGADGVLVSSDLEIIEFYGSAHRYVRPAAGQASFSLVQMAHQDLLPDLCMAVYAAKKEEGPVVKTGVSSGRSKPVAIVVTPLFEPGSNFYFLIQFKESKKISSGSKHKPPAAETGKLKRELLLAKQALVEIMREQGGMAEEFRAQNEEIQSSNEEFQSTNEELETAKEELQSANEEMTTVNSEMEIRNAELIRINDDLSNLIASVHTSIILVDAELKVRRFTEKASKSMGFASTDIGRRITEIALNVPVQPLEAFIREVIDTLEPKEREVQDNRGLWYLIRVRPYRRQDGKTDGAVLMFIDIMDLKRGMMQLQDAKHYSESIVETLWEPLVALDSTLHIKSANKAFYSFFKVEKKDTDGRLIYDLGNGQWNIPRLRKLLEDLLAQNGSFYNFEMEHDFPGIGHKLMILNAHKIALKDGEKEQVIILAFQDISEQRHSEEALNKIAAELSYSNRELDNFASTAAHDLQSPLNKIHVFAERLLGEAVSEKGQSYLKTMIKSSSRMRNLVENLLRVSRVTKQGEEQECVELDDVVREVLSDMTVTIEEAGAVVERTKLPALTANRVQLRQLFQNLIGNAVKYRKKTLAPHVVIAGRVAASHIEVTVRDNGIGFDEKYASEIFKPFKRLHGASSEYEGSGIGLALCQKIMHHHGGEIFVTSRPGDGSTFTLMWPPKRLAASEKALPGAAAGDAPVPAA